MLRLRMVWSFSLLICLSAWAAEKHSVQELTTLANSHDSGLSGAIAATFDEKDLKAGTASLGHGSEFFFALEADAQPTLMIDDAPRIQRL